MGFQHEHPDGQQNEEHGHDSVSLKVELEMKGSVSERRGLWRLIGNVCV